MFRLARIVGVRPSRPRRLPGTYVRRAAVAMMATCLVLAAGAQRLEGQGWMRMPDGGWGYRHDIELVAQPWRCGNPGIMTCTVNGNSLTLAHGGASFTLTMALAERQTVVATNVRQTITLGSIRTSMVGAFVVPPPVSPWHEMFSFTMFLRSSEPLATSTARGLVSWNGTRVDSLYSGVERTGFGLQTLPHPTGLNYGTVYFRRWRVSDDRRFRYRTRTLHLAPPRHRWQRSPAAPCAPPSLAPSRGGRRRGDLSIGGSAREPRHEPVA